LSIGGRTFGRFAYYKNPYPVIIFGNILILPYLIYLLKSKPNKKTILKSNAIDLSKIGLSMTEYLERKEQKKKFEVFVKNETDETIIVNRKSLLEPNCWYVFTINKYKSLFLSNGIEFHITKELTLETVDLRNQILGLGGDYLKENDVPEYVDWAFIITENNQGDGL
jgi:hypothetical protein